MRTQIAILLVFGCGILQAQPAAFEEALLRGKVQIGNAQTAEEFQAVSNYFERIAEKEQGQWLPLYYQAQCMAIKGSNTPDPGEKDEVLIDALDIIQVAKNLEKNSELIALEGFVQMLRLTVDPATRGQTLSPIIFGLFGTALQMDPKNPRALLFLGQMHHGTAQFFGGSFEEACGYLQKAYDIFEMRGEEETINPDWGLGAAIASLQICNQ